MKNSCEKKTLPVNWLLAVISLILCHRHAATF